MVCESLQQIMQSICIDVFRRISRNFCNKFSIQHNLQYVRLCFRYSGTLKSARNQLSNFLLGLPKKIKSFQDIKSFPLLRKNKGKGELVIIFS